MSTSTKTVAVRAAALLFAVAVFEGCVSTDTETGNAINDLRYGDGTVAVKWSGDLATNSTYSTALGEVEAGRVDMLLGKHQSSQQWFRTAVERTMDRNEAQPQIKLGDVGNTVLASTITDDRTREYAISPYELNMALEYAILTEEFCGMREDALVDCRLAAYVMDNLAETYGADVAKEAENTSTNAAVSSVYQEQAAALDEVIAKTRNSWENPLLWWLTGVLFEASGDKEAASQSYMRAKALKPENTIFAEDALKVRTRKSPASGLAKLVVVCGEDFISERKSLKIPVPVYTAMSIDIPMYEDKAYTPKTIMISVDGAAPTQAELALNVQSLAYRDLREHLPGIITRNITRALVQAGAQAAVNITGNRYAKLAVLAMNAVASAVRSSDIRCWRTLPMSEQVWRNDSLKPGKHRLDINFGYGYGSVSTEVTLKAGQTAIIYVNSKEPKKQ